MMWRCGTPLQLLLPLRDSDPAGTKGTPVPSAGFRSADGGYMGSTPVVPCEHHEDAEGWPCADVRTID